jgi:thiamine biosynthesis protein ThiI
MVPVTGPQHHCILVRYGELALKSRKVRARFTSRLKENIIDAFAAADLDCVVEDDGGHLYVYSSDLDGATRRVSRVFGVVSVSPAARLEFRELEELTAAVAEYSSHVIEPGTKFAIRARRTGEHPFSSMELAKEAGSAVWTAFDGDLTVDLDHPDTEIEVEVRNLVAYIYHRRVTAVGGLPLGSQGRVLCPLRGREDAVAAWMIMRRGCATNALLVEGDEAGQELLGTMREWEPGIHLRTLSEEEWGWPAIYREMGRSHSLAVVSGARGPDVPELPPDRDREPVVFFPLVGLDDERFAELEDLVFS